MHLTVQTTWPWLLIVAIAACYLSCPGQARADQPAAWFDAETRQSVVASMVSNINSSGLAAKDKGQLHTDMTHYVDGVAMLVDDWELDGLYQHEPAFTQLSHALDDALAGATINYYFCIMHAGIDLHDPAMQEASSVSESLGLNLQLGAATMVIGYLTHQYQARGDDPAVLHGTLRSEEQLGPVFEALQNNAAVQQDVRQACHNSLSPLVQAGRKHMDASRG